MEDYVRIISRARPLNNYFVTRENAINIIAFFFLLFSYLYIYSRILVVHIRYNMMLFFVLLLVYLIVQVLFILYC